MVGLVQPCHRHLSSPDRGPLRSAVLPCECVKTNRYCVHCTAAPANKRSICVAAGGKQCIATLSVSRNGQPCRQDAQLRTQPLNTLLLPPFPSTERARDAESLQRPKLQSPGQGRWAVLQNHRRQQGSCAAAAEKHPGAHRYHTVVHAQECGIDNTRPHGHKASSANTAQHLHAPMTFNSTSAISLPFIVSMQSTLPLLVPPSPAGPGCLAAGALQPLVRSCHCRMCGVFSSKSIL